MQARKLELHICDLANIQHNFQRVADAFHAGNVVEHHKAETTCEDMYCMTHLLVAHMFEGN
jgi:hypothetical protein